MSTPPLTIRKAETLLARLEAIEAETTKRAHETRQRAEQTLRINGATLIFSVTPSIAVGRFYRLFRVNGKRVPKHKVSERLLTPTQ